MYFEKNEQKLETQQGVIRVLVKKFVPQTMPTGSPPCLLKQSRTSYSGNTGPDDEVGYELPK